MMDATSVGISPLISSPYVTTDATTTMIPDQTAYMPVESVVPTTYDIPTTTYTTGSIPATTTYTTGSFPVLQDTTYQMPGMVQGYETTDLTYATPQTYVADATTSYIPDAGLTSFAPQIGGPDQVLTSLAPEVVTTPEVSVIPDAGIQSVVPSVPVASSVVPSVVVPDASSLAVPQASTIVPPPAEMPAQIPPPGNSRLIADEDFERGRPVYNEFSEDRYRGFRFLK